ncbi:MAG: valine--tRNA ligase [Dehalococcoidia bacterium]|jgi:valyl-tRNA synthetase
MGTRLSEIPKAYDPQIVEARLYKHWIEKGYFTPKIDCTKQPFVIIMPPPNITGELHLGHALTATLEDIMTRWHRMQGEPTLWLPGIDHAGIATQFVVEKMLAKEGKTRHDLGREKFVERVWEWRQKYGNNIAEQHKRLGASCDWSRERFTMDAGPYRAVRTTFVRLYEKGLIYRGERLVNWCPRCTTAVSDLEVDHKDTNGNLWYVRYNLKDSSDFITVATTRPETILGDTAVAVNPNDAQYTHLVGRTVVLPVVGREIPIIMDESVEQAFGTGAVKVTPAHDPIDFETGQRHNLPIINILNPNGTMNENAGPYRNLDRFECRKQLVADLEKEGLLVKVEPHQHAVGHCSRCNAVIEPWVSKQWFVKIAPLAQPAIAAVADGRIKIIPERFNKVYLNWMENIRDWCISRQLWWGHRIPVWYCRDCNEMNVAVEEPKKCKHCGSTRLEQDPDVLDTWFSSGLWPHSTLGWPDKTEDLDYFYPTSVMETAYDIIFFWVARMIMMGLENMGDVPFRTVYLHGLIRDEKGEKMSKVKGNVVNPLDLIDKYGTDALRIALSTGTSPGNDIKLSDSKLEASRNFCNKLWNASRFILGNIDETSNIDLSKAKLTIEDRWILSRLHRLIQHVDQSMKDFQFGEAFREIHDFVWGEFCDWYIEISKLRLKDKENSPLPVLVHVLDTSLRLLHPAMPFITEEIWQNVRPLLGGDVAESIMISPYPTADVSRIDDEVEKRMAIAIDIVRAIRNTRSELHVEPAKWIEATIAVTADMKQAIETQAQSIEILARARPLTIIDTAHERPDKAKTIVLSGAEVILPMSGMVDMNVERTRLQKEIDGCTNEIARLEVRLADEKFTSKAPAQVVERERGKLTALKEKLATLNERLSEL